MPGSRQSGVLHRQRPGTIEDRVCPISRVSKVRLAFSKKSSQQRGTPSIPEPLAVLGSELFGWGKLGNKRPVQAARRTRRKYRRTLAFSGIDCAAVHERFRVSTTPCICTYYRQATSSLCRACLAAPSTCAPMYVCAALDTYLYLGAACTSHNTYLVWGAQVDTRGGGGEISTLCMRRPQEIFTYREGQVLPIAAGPSSRCPAVLPLRRSRHCLEPTTIPTVVIVHVGGSMHMAIEGLEVASLAI
ncbi:hypothetical protein M440DRAFT_1043165 [Trichoderma longibrachiatum ATCC 18648]|uniref:Uncharacterized protein n=1 Tax=Trichoderma longibrachiatum ATCC 18648 TaxID=983965 RepID=A0A2T4BY55_TRILO|nr:hypothetical protein M440DRAFT_1043165 [Trichoderma longibrachiatum ATCC 18648]